MILGHVAAVFYRSALQQTGIPPGINHISEIKTEGAINVKLTKCNAFLGASLGPGSKEEKIEVNTRHKERR